MIESLNNVPTYLTFALVLVMTEKMEVLNPDEF